MRLPLFKNKTDDVKQVLCFLCLWLPVDAKEDVISSLAPWWVWSDTALVSSDVEDEWEVEEWWPLVVVTHDNVGSLST